MIRTDAGVHIWPALTPDRPWLDGRSPHLPQPLGRDELLSLMAGSGIDRAVLVPPSWAGDFNDYCRDVAARDPQRFAVMGRIAIEKPESREALKTWKDQPGMLGVRLTLNHAWDEGWIADGTADWFWPEAEGLGIPVMLNAPGVLTDLGRVAERHPGLRLIIDHMGRPKGPKDAAIGECLARTASLARHPNVYVKLTLMPTCSTDAYPYRNIQPFVRHLIESFGPKRSFWGSDASALLSRTSCSYEQNVRLFTEEMDFLSSDDLEWIMGRGLAECLPWPVAADLPAAPRKDSPA